MAWVSRCVGDCVDDDTIVVNEYDLDTTQTHAARARQLLQPVARLGRARLGARRRARAPSWPRPSTAVDLLRGRRRLHLRHADRRALDLAGPQPARALRDLQQPRVERGEALGAASHAPRTAGRCAPDHAAERARARARLRDDRSGLRRPGPRGSRIRRRCRTPLRQRAATSCGRRSGRRCSTSSARSRDGSPADRHRHRPQRRPGGARPAARRRPRGRDRPAARHAGARAPTPRPT